ncbi:MAG: PilN domain-containing protein [Phycisphaeraceae bacterium]|nr:PilN domain-containing protein [Phycisphaeraceae bacterium]
MNEINFLPQSFLEAQKRKQRLFREVSILGGMVLIAIALFAGQAGQVSTVRNLAAQKQDELVAAKIRSVEVAKLSQQPRELKLKLAVNQGLVMPLNPSALLAVIAEILPPQMALTEIQFSADAPKLDLSSLKKKSSAKKVKKSKKKAAIRYVPKVMKIQMLGLSPTDVDVANLVGALSASTVFQNVKMNYSKTAKIANVTAREFRLEMEMSMDCIYENQLTLKIRSQNSSAKEVAHVN